MPEAQQAERSSDDQRRSTEGECRSKADKNQAYKISIEAWHAESERFWKAFATILTLNAGMFAFVGLKDPSTGFHIGIAVLGIGICITWHFLQRGYAGWTDGWEEIVKKYESGLPPVFRDRKRPGMGISTKWLAGFFPWFVALCWLALLLQALSKLARRLGNSGNSPGEIDMWITVFTGVTALAAVIYTGTFCWSVYVLKKQWKVSALATVTERLQREEVRAARRDVIKRGQKDSPWEEHEVRQAEIVCHTYDSVGQMVKRKLIAEDMVLDEWGDSLRRCWLILKPYVLKRRTETSWKHVWDDFEKLGEAALRQFGEPPAMRDDPVMPG